jgi:hypothetical protein
MLLLKLRAFVIILLVSVGFLFYSEFNSDDFVVDSTKNFTTSGQIIVLAYY